MALIKTKPKHVGFWHTNFQGTSYPFGQRTVFFGVQVQAVFLVQCCHSYALVTLDKSEMIV